MIRTWMLSFGLLAGLLATAGSAQAVKYMKIGEAVKSFLPEGAKISKVTVKLTAAQRGRLATDYGWDASEPKYVFYVGKDGGGKAVGYVTIIPELFGTCFHKYAVGLTPQGDVIETAIVELSCPRAFPINRRSFLKQFRGKRHADALTIKVDIDAVTGATYSSESTATATRKATSLHNLVFGGGEAVKVSAAVQKAREAARAAIQKAVESGELVEKK